MKKIFSVPQSLFRFFFSLSWKKKTLFVTVALLLVVVILLVFNRFFSSPDYTTESVMRRDLSEIVTESGYIKTSGKVDMYSTTNGIVEEVYVQNGDAVVEGQELFQVKSTATTQEQQAAYANYLAAKNSLEDGEAVFYSLESQKFSDWDTFKSLAESDTYENDDGTPKDDKRTLPEFHIVEKQWLAAEAQVKNQETAISQAQAQVASTWLLYQATQNSVVTSPISGIVSNLSAIPGSSVLINSLSVPTTPVLSVGTYETTEAAIILSENDVVKVRPGQEVVVDVDAVDSKTYMGTVRRVDTIGTDVQGVIRYFAYVEILDPDDLLRPGMSVDAEIETETLERVLTVPNQAIKPHQGGRAVRVPGENDEIEFVPVETGVRGEEYTQIISGLSENDIVITSLASEEKQSSGPFGF